MNTIKTFILFFIAIISVSSCASKKTLKSVREELDMTTSNLLAAETNFENCNENLISKEKFIEKQKGERATLEKELTIRQEQIDDLREQIADLRRQREQQVAQVGDLTVLSQSANDNISQTIKQLEQKDKYINLIQAARTKTDSMNLALAINLKSVLQQGISDEDVEVQVDKTVVFINLSDKMLYQSGSAILTARSNEVLAKIAQIVQSRPDVEVMVEGYTDDRPIKTDCMQDNWDLSVKRSTAVIRVLQEKYGVDPNKLIAAGRGQYNTLADNSTAEGRATNRRTRIIILPKLDQFYDLLNPANAAK